MGGAAGPRAARLAARYADEYNTVMPTLEEIAERKAEHRRGVREGRARADPVHGHDRRCVIGADEAELRARAWPR